MATRALDKQTPVWNRLQIREAVEEIAVAQGITLTTEEKAPIVAEIAKRFGV
jgi:hypothetical protein